MDPADFGTDAAGHLVPIKGYDDSLGRNYEHFAFVPDPLPSEPRLRMATYKRVAEASLALGRLDSAAEKLPNPQLLVRPALHKEAQSTSALEGTHATLFDVLEAEFLDKTRRSSQVSEVLNYVDAATQGLELIQKRPITTTAIADLQGVLVKGTRGGSWDAGIRRSPVYLAGAKAGMEHSRFVPVPEGPLLIEGMNAWEAWINAKDDVPLLVKAALGHYQFETLHPFTDGNGRMGRLVVTLQLVDGKALRYPILNISTYFEPRKDRYKDLLLACSQSGQFDDWVQFFCDAVEAQANAEIDRINALLDFRTQLLEELKTANAKGVVLDIVDDLIAYPVITASQAASMHQVTFPPANNAIQRLVDMGYLAEVTGRQYGRVFLCRRVMEIVDSVT